MRKVKRFGLFLLVIIIACCLAPYITGMLFKRNYLNIVDLNSHGKAQVVEYHVGWLTSDAKITIPMGSSSITLVQEIFHGPYPVDPATDKRTFVQAIIQTNVHLDNKTESTLLGSANADGIVQAHTLVSFSNDYTSDLKSPLMNVKLGAQGKFVWQGATGTMDTSISNNYIHHVVSDFKLGAVNATNNNISFNMLPSSAHSDITCDDTSSFLCSGTQHFSIPQMWATDQQNQTAKVLNLTVNATGENKNNNYSNTFLISVGSVNSSTFSLTNSSLKISYNNLNSAELGNLVEKLRSDQDQYTDARSRQLAAAADLNSALPKIIMPTTSIAEDLKVVTPSGALTSTGKLFWPPNTSPNTTVDLMMNANAQLTVRASTTLVDEMIKEIDAKKEAEEQAAVLAHPAAIVEEPPPPPLVIDVTKSPAYQQLATQTTQMVGTKAISPQIQLVLLNMAKNHTPKNDFNDAISAMMKGKQIPLATADNLLELYNVYYSGDQNYLMAIVFAAPAKNLHDLKNKIISLAQIKAISDNVANQLIDLQQQSLAPEIYAIALDKFVKSNDISPELESQLKSQYGVINKDLSLNVEAGLSNYGSPNATQGTATPQAPPAPKVGEVQAQFDSLIKQGYVVQDINDYVLSIEYSGGILKVNGKPVKNIPAAAAGAAPAQ